VTPWQSAHTVAPRSPPERGAPPSTPGAPCVAGWTCLSGPSSDVGTLFDQWSNRVPTVEQPPTVNRSTLNRGSNEMNLNHGQAIACYTDLADVPAGSVYVTDVRPDRVVYLVFAIGGDQ